MQLEFDSPLKLIVNVLTIAIWLVAAIDVLRSPKRDWYNLRGKVITALVVIGPAIFYRGVFLPVMPLVWLVWWRNAGGLGHLPRDRRPGSGPGLSTPTVVS